MAAPWFFFTVAVGLACPCHWGVEVSDSISETFSAGIFGVSGSARQLESFAGREHRGPAAFMDDFARSAARCCPAAEETVRSWWGVCLAALEHW